MPRVPARIGREKRAVRAMIRLYCRAKHATEEALCTECAELAAYAEGRLDRCPFQEKKSACIDCEVHCYKPDMRARIRTVMRFSGPRLLFRHPIIAVRHILDSRRSKPSS
ncbi:MAG: nitrous oxide-stimulated promoter family protein [Candidatus Nealsonbacteria bacterium]|nr:nitrous oxide-stimulated promoter family protein [Candidatus Nealsonbacteria bacterium]